MNENKIVILTVLLLCSAPMAKPKAMMSKMKTEINTNLEAMDMQLQQIENSTTTRSTSALCSLLSALFSFSFFYWFLLSPSLLLSLIYKNSLEKCGRRSECVFFLFEQKITSHQMPESRHLTCRTENPKMPIKDKSRSNQFTVHGK